MARGGDLTPRDSLRERRRSVVSDRRRLGYRVGCGRTSADHPQSGVIGLFAGHIVCHSTAQRDDPALGGTIDVKASTITLDDQLELNAIRVPVYCDGQGLPSRSDLI